MPSPLRLTGIPASPGYAEGPLFSISEARSCYTAKGSAEGETQALEGAISAALGKTRLLIAGLSGESADILEFQVSMLEDQALAEPALAMIAEGTQADRAWRAAMDIEIAGYEQAEDDYFKARAVDLADIRDRVLAELSGEARVAAGHGVILVGDDIAPSVFLETDWSHGGGIALRRGSAASHVAMLARARGVPMLVGVDFDKSAPEGHALLDAESGNMVVGATDHEQVRFRDALSAFLGRRREAENSVAKPAVTRDGAAVRVMLNIAAPSDLDRLDQSHCDGVGLMRTEFLFGGVNRLPDEATQFHAYRSVLEWAGDRPVTIRTVDAGGDKPVAGYTEEEGNPFLGLRGIRLSLARPEIFRVQVRALLRAAVHGDLKVMFPMIAVPGEFVAAKALFDEEAQRLEATGIEYRMPPLGIMVEVPSVAIFPEAFCDVGFFSIGSNDLTQYVMAAARDNGAVAALNDVRNPAVQRLIAGVVLFGAKSGIPVSLCGDAGGDPAAIPSLLRAGLRELSVAPAQLAMAKATIADTEL